MILSGENKLSLQAPGSITLKGLKVTGEKKRVQVGTIGKNSTIALDSSRVTLEGINASSIEGAYNLIEQPYSTSSIPLKEVKVKGLVGSQKITHNLLNFYSFANNAKVVLERCDFQLSTSSNAIRFDNLQGATGVEVLLKGCNWSYEGQSWTPEDIPWLCPVLLETAQKSQLGTPIMGKAYGWTFTFQGCTYNGRPLKEFPVKKYSGTATPEEWWSLVAVADDSFKESGYLVPETPEYAEFFPEVIIIK